MRITHFTHLRPAQAFVDYMATRGIRLRIEQDGGYTLWLDDESQIGVVENELNQFFAIPTMRAIRQPAGTPVPLKAACIISTLRCWLICANAQGR